MTFQLKADAVEIYERVIVPLWFEHWSKALMEIAIPQKGDAVLDVACGTGVTTRLAKRLVGSDGEVTGLDISASMLELARELAKELDINWLHTDVSNIDLPDEHFNLVLSQQGYQYFPDKKKALSELNRVLMSGGKLVFTVWDGQSVYTQAVCTALEKYISPDAANTQRRQRETPPPQELRRALLDAGYVDVCIKRQELEIKVPLAPEFVPLHLGSMPIGTKFSGLSETTKQRFVDDVEGELINFVRDEKLIYPDAVNTVTGIKP